MAEIEEFVKRIRVHARRVDDRRGRLLRRTALAVDQAVVLATPVDKGRARANWVVGLGEPNTGIVSEFPEGVEGSSGAAAAQQAMGRARDIINNADPDVRQIWISNNLPYINRLNDGWSAQAPAGFVEEAVAAGVAAVQEFRLLDE